MSAAAHRQPQNALDVAAIFPSIDEELAPFAHLFRGRVLNAGAGNRDISALIDGELVNQDIAEGLHNERIDILSPLDRIPVHDAYFDGIICNAVLEHVENPEDVVAEFARVCRPGGVLYLTVPFLQPEHLDPSDYQRYTADGLRGLVARHGFDVVSCDSPHNVYATLAWIAVEWLREAPGLRGKVLRRTVIPSLRRAARRPGRNVHSIASAYRVVARRASV